MNRELNNMYMLYDVTKASGPPSTLIENLEQPCFDLRSMITPKHLKLAYLKQAL